LQSGDRFLEGELALFQAGEAQLIDVGSLREKRNRFVQVPVLGPQLGESSAQIGVGSALPFASPVPDALLL